MKIELPKSDFHKAGERSLQLEPLLRVLLFSMLALLVLSLWGCTTTKGDCLAVPPEHYTQVFVTSYGWHAGIVLPFTSAKSRIPELADFNDVNWAEIGWGDRRYYTDDDPGLYNALVAGLLPTASTIHVVGLKEDPPSYFGTNNVMPLRLKDSSFTKLVKFLSSKFDRENESKSIPFKSSNSPDSFFYPATESFSIWRTCNTWLAEALEYAGCQMSSPLPRRNAALRANVCGLATNSTAGFCTK